MEQSYYKYDVENLFTVSKLITVHYFEFEPHFAAKAESHDFWEMVCAVKNPLVCMADGEEILLKEGEVLFHKPGETHSLSGDAVNPPDVFVITFECQDEAVRFFENKHISLDKHLLQYVYLIIEESKNTFRLSQCTPDIKKMPLAKSDSMGGLQLIKNLLEILLIGIMRKETGNFTADTLLMQEDFDERITKEIIAFLKENLDKSLTVDDIARELSYAKSYLFRQFKKATGDTIMSYFLKLKVQAAKKMLREGRLSISEISAQLAFDSPNYFSKVFKRITHRTPTQYKAARA